MASLPAVTDAPAPRACRATGRLLNFDVALTALVAAVYLTIALATIADYGVAWDCSEMYLGDRNLQFLLTLDPSYLDYGRQMPMPEYGRPDHPDFQAVARAARINLPINSPQDIFPLGYLTSSLTKKIFYSWLGWLPAIEAHHLAPILWFTLLLVAFHRFALSTLGRWPAAIGVLALATYPRLLAHSHFNLKNIPALTLVCLVVFSFYRGVTSGNPRSILIAAALWGAANATGPNSLFLPVILGPWLAWVLWQRRRAGRRPLGPGLPAALLAFPFLSVAVTLACWPFQLVDFPRHLADTAGFLVSFGFGGDGRWHAGPVINGLVTMPVPVLVLAVAGAVAVCRRRASLGGEGLALLLGTWLIVPPLRVSVPAAVDYDVIRHWLEFVPPLCAFAGIGGAWILSRLAEVVRRSLPEMAATAPAALGRGGALCLIGLAFSPTVAWEIRNHPNELVFYNSLVGRLRGAQRLGLKGATDYWAISTRTGLRWLNAHAEPNAALVVPIGHSTVAYTEKVWLRNDIRFINSEVLDAEEVRRQAAAYPGVVYLMYVTRAEFYAEDLRALDTRVSPVFTIRVDGGDILRILRFDQRGTP